MTVYAKDPASVVDYSFDWSGWLSGGESISTVSWSLDPAGGSAPTLGSEVGTGSTRGIYVSGGAAGHRYRLSGKIVTDAGRTAERSVTLHIMER
ncbi:phage fiber-tail adaptor protein [Kordiimonas pumila]|uniref:Uncharacterized protein n=1 Tax=Kordiimonas pumila TaxID=2161677 RepID=A0ABV7D3Z4_9PROT|nr:hypothetical protein [Kordiimonas pumila]